MDYTSHQLPYPVLTEDADGPTAFRLLAQAVDAQYGGEVANPAALPVAGTFNGQRIWVTSENAVATWDGTAWNGYWKDYVPTFSAGVVAAAGSVFKYIRVGKLITVEFLLILNAAPSVGVINMTLPEAAAQTSNQVAAGQVVFRDNSVGNSSRRSGTAMFSIGNVFFQVDSLTTNAGVTDAVPWAWASSDSIGGTLQYRLA